ncbi:MAG: TSUP family transporter, partial [Kiritimatiellales bacterium]|nr:TSUP family transporter [Kiritimatiellales bacterium]
AIQAVSANLLGRAIPLLLIAVFIYMISQPELGALHRPHRIAPSLFYLVFGLLLGFYDGFFGPGTGSFWALAFVAGLGFDLKKATAHTKVMNFTSNIVSLVFFLLGGNVLLKVGLVMGVGQVAGAFLGSHLVLQRGTRFIRIFFLSVVAVTIAKLVWDTYF